MSKLRPTLRDATSGTYYPTGVAAYLAIYNAVKDHPSGLLHGKLEQNGERCAIGCYFDRHSKTALEDPLIDEVAFINDSVPSKTMKQRRTYVLSWLRWRLEKMGYVLPGRKPKKPEELA